MKTVKMKFITETGKSFYVSMDYAAPTLAEPEGAAKVQAAVDLILEQQPFAVVLVSCEAAELIDRTSTANALVNKNWTAAYPSPVH